MYNSAIGLGEAQGLYHKRQLVPFGEYIPMSSLLGEVFKIFNLPTPGISLGPEPGGILTLARQQLTVQPLICYEVVYPELGRQAAQHPVLITISNDAWFGHSLGPLQHLQMAQMRALENQRYLIRSTNNGISAIVGPAGELLATSEQFKQQNLTGEVWAKHGLTPFGEFGQWLYLALAAALLAVTSCIQITRRA
jgi:apolipoprotein N-acyltransferase